MPRTDLLPKLIEPPQPPRKDGTKIGMSTILSIILVIGILVTFVIAITAVTSGTDAIIPLIIFLLASLGVALLVFILWRVHRSQRLRLPLVAPPPPSQLLLSSPEHLLVLSDSCRLPQSMLYTSTLLIEDSIRFQQRASAADRLLEEIRRKLRQVALLVITTETTYPDPTKWSYIAGSTRGELALDDSLRSRYAVVERGHEPEFCSGLIMHSDHVVLNLASYSDRAEAAALLRNVFFHLYSFSLMTQRKCLVMMMDAEKLLPSEAAVQKFGFFPDPRDAFGVHDDFFKLIGDGAEVGIHPILVAKGIAKLSQTALASSRLVLTNKPLQANELEPFWDYIGVPLDDLNGLFNQGKVLLADTQRLQKTQGAGGRKQKSPEVLEFLLRPSTFFSPLRTSQPTPVPSVQVQQREPVQAYDPPLTATDKQALISFATFLAPHELPAVSFTEMLVHPPESLHPQLESLGLLQRLLHQGFLCTSADAQILQQNKEAIMPENELHDQQNGPRAPVALRGEAKRSMDAQHGQEQILRKERSLPQDPVPTSQGWQLPPLSLFHPAQQVDNQLQQQFASHQVRILQNALRSFKVDAEIRDSDVSIGPTLIRIGIRPTGKPEMKPDAQTGKLIPVRDAAGNIVYETRTKVSQITRLYHDFALVLEAKTIRMEAPVAGHSYVGVEIPCKTSRLVTLREVLESEEYQLAKAKSKLAVALGEDVAGVVRVGDLARMPHLLIAGATGAGKSIMINAIIASIITQATPDDVRLLMVDPKMVELNMYNGIPHLLSPVVTEVGKVVSLLKNGITEMERRYRLFSQLGVRNLDGYRRIRAEHMAKGDSSLANLPAIVIIIDELADLMMAAPEEVEGMICRLAQLARATGIHLIVATQRPSVDVITGLIKANIPTRISFMVSSAVDSRTIIDMGGAERLLGRGDMLYLPSDAGTPTRIQGSFVDDKEVENLVQFWRKQAIQHAIAVNNGATVSPVEIDTHVEPGWELKEQDAEGGELDDELLGKAEEVVREYGKASISLLQRRLKIGYSRAARLTDLLLERGVLSMQNKGLAIVPPDREEANLVVNTPQALDSSSETSQGEHEDVLETLDADALYTDPPLRSDVVLDDDILSESDVVIEDNTTDDVVTAPLNEENEARDDLKPAFLQQTFGRRLWPLLQGIAQGKDVEIIGNQFLIEELELLVAARLFVREEISAEQVKKSFHVNSRATNLLDRLEKIHLLRPYDGGARPRRITEDRGGEALPEKLRILRRLVDSYSPERERLNEQLPSL